MDRDRVGGLGRFANAFSPIQFNICSEWCQFLGWCLAYLHIYFSIANHYAIVHKQKKNKTKGQLV